MPSIALVDDHTLLRVGLASLVESFGHSITFEADNGKEFLEKITTHPIPELVLMDINMPEMDGYQTTRWLKENIPAVHVLALSMYDNEISIIRMLKSGAKGYILKDSDPSELKSAIESVFKNGYYYSDLVSGKLINAVNNPESPEFTPLIQLNKRENDFLKYACSDLTYKEIAKKMFLSPRTIDGYRDDLFEKLQVKTRIGLAIYAIKNGLVDINH